MKKNPEKIVLIALLMLVIGVILDLVMIFGSKIFPHTLTSLMAIGAQLIIMLSVYVIYKNSK